MRMLIKNGRVIDPASNTDDIRDILVEDGVIAEVAKDIDKAADTVIDAKGCMVMPGLVDLHVHFREPGFEHKETIRTGARAAARGGFTTVCPMPNTKPAIDSVEMVEYIKNKSEEVTDIKESITGDNVEATQNICSLADIPNDKVVTGEEFSKLSLAEQKKMVEEVSVFARLTPLEKDNIIKLLKENGHVVGYMGDGVNDAPSLIRADVGISVNTATSIAKEASDIILLKKSLKVVYEGVLEGRKVYGNIMKYMKMALSAAFGDVFSVFLASIFLPFLPMLPIQFLLQDLLYDMSQTMIPFDDVDKEFLIVPHKWDTSDLRRFMNIMGVVASSIDIVAFIGFYYLLGFDANHAVMFQTAWFIEGVISQTLIVHFVRTAKIPFIESTANKYLLISTFLCIIASMILPILLAPIKSFHFTYLPLNFYIFVIFLSLLYIVVEEIVKKMYIKKYKRWL